MKSNKQKIILDLQKKAAEVLALKQERRQKRPIVIEFSGSPKAGKTSCINSLELFLKRNGFTVEIVQERASVCPVSDKHSPMFNIWTACMSLAGLIGTLVKNKENVDVLILDRGIFDALCWFEWLVSNSKMEIVQRNVAESFLLMEELVKSIDIVFAFSVEPDISIEREFATLLTNIPGSIMNKKVLQEYKNAVEYTAREKVDFFHKIFVIDTSNKDQDTVGKEVTEITLDTLSNLLMERIGYFEIDNRIRDILESKEVFSNNEIYDILPEMKFELRNRVEGEAFFLQPIPVAIITNKKRDKILAIKKNKSAVSEYSPEKNKLLLYIGGHSRYEDMTEINSHDFLAICRTTLKREVKEEVGISIALNEIAPFYIYSTNTDRSKHHLAICFVLEVDEEGLALHLDPQELILGRGKSKSGKFLKLEELQNERELEHWSKIILEICFSGEIENKQFSIFEFYENTV